MTAARPANKSADYVWLNGQLVPWENATIHVTTMGSSGGISVFEGINAYHNAEQDELYIFQLDPHMRRLFESMKMLRMRPEYALADLTPAVLEVLRANRIHGDTYIRPVAFYSGLQHSTFTDTVDAAPEILIWTKPFKSTLNTERHIACCVSSWTRIADNVMPPRIKCMSNYQNNRMAAMEARINGYDSAIMLTAEGRVSEGPGACLMIVRDGVVITPTVTSGILESVTRSTLLRVIREVLAVPAIEREIDRTELYVAEEAFFCGTAAEVTPVTSVDRLPVGSGEIGPLTRVIAQLYHDLARGTDPRYPEFRTAVYNQMEAA